jgi:hypothetical protein
MAISALTNAFAKQANIANLALLLALIAILWENVLLHRQVARLGRDLAEASRRFDEFVAELDLFKQPAIEARTVRSPLSGAMSTGLSGLSVPRALVRHADSISRRSRRPRGSRRSPPLRKRDP